MAIAVLAIIMGGVTAMFTVTRAGGAANRNERVDVLLTAFGEAVKNLPYVPCADAAGYQGPFDAAEAAAPAPKRIAQSTDATLSVDSVAPGPDCPTLDPGTQTVTLTATLGTQRRTGEIVKRDPSPRPLQLVARLNPTQLSQDGEAQVAFALDGIGSSSPSGIATYAYSCPGAVGTTNFSVTSEDDGSVQCVFAAPATGNPAITRTATLTITDNQGRTATDTKVLTIQPRTAIPEAPISLFTFSPTTNILTGQTITFTSQSTPPAGGQIDRWEWDFDDGTTLSCTRPDLSCTTAVHTYTVAKTSYTVRHWVTSDTGVRRESSQSVAVSAAILLKPSVSFTFSPSIRLAPQRVTFDGTASQPPPGGTITGYAWEFGDGATGTGAGPTHDYNLAGSYSVRLTVTASNGQTNSLTIVVGVAPLVAPPDMRSTGAVCYNNFLGFCIGGAKFSFGWTNVDRPPGDTVKYRIQVQRTQWCSYFFGTQEIVVTANASGTSQVGELNVGPLAACKGTYIWRVQVEKTSALGTVTSSWSAPVSFTL